MWTLRRAANRGQRLQQILQRAGEQLDDHTQSIKELKAQRAQLRVEKRRLWQDVRELQRYFVEQRQIQARTAQRILVGQVAYTLCSLAENFMFRGEDTGEITTLSLNKLAERLTGSS